VVFIDDGNFSLESFDRLTSWLTDARQLSRPDVSVIAVGNKSDLKEHRAINFLEASRFSQENGPNVSF